MSEIKVTDKRMFTPDGRLREEFEREIETAAEEPPAASPPPEAAAPPTAAARADERGPGLELPGTPPELGGPTFFDLVAVLAEPVPVYLGDVPLPDGGSAENLEAARFHIDLLDLLRKRTAGNLAAQEHAALEDLLYRLRLRYVQKRG